MQWSRARRVDLGSDLAGSATGSRSSAAVSSAPAWRLLAAVPAWLLVQPSPAAGLLIGQAAGYRTIAFWNPARASCRYDLAPAPPAAQAPRQAIRPRRPSRPQLR